MLPSGWKLMSVTMARRGPSGLSEVRSVESFSGSIGKITAEV